MKITAYNLNKLIEQHYGKPANVFKIIGWKNEIILQVEPEPSDMGYQLVYDFENGKLIEDGKETLEALMSNLCAQGYLDRGEYVISYD